MYCVVTGAERSLDMIEDNAFLISKKKPKSYDPYWSPALRRLYKIDPLIQADGEELVDFNGLKQKFGIKDNTYFGDLFNSWYNNTKSNRLPIRTMPILLNRDYGFLQTTAFMSLHVNSKFYSPNSATFYNMYNLYQDYNDIRSILDQNAILAAFLTATRHRPQEQDKGFFSEILTKSEENPADFNIRKKYDSFYKPMNTDDFKVKEDVKTRREKEIEFLKKKIAKNFGQIKTILNNNNHISDKELADLGKEMIRVNCLFSKTKDTQIGPYIGRLMFKKQADAAGELLNEGQAISNLINAKKNAVGKMGAGKIIFNKIGNQPFHGDEDDEPGQEDDEDAKKGPPPDGGAGPEGNPPDGQGGNPPGGGFGGNPPDGQGGNPPGGGLGGNPPGGGPGDDPHEGLPINLYGGYRRFSPNGRSKLNKNDDEDDGKIKKLKKELLEIEQKEEEEKKKQKLKSKKNGEGEERKKPNEQTNNNSLTNKSNWKSNIAILLIILGFLCITFGTLMYTNVIKNANSLTKAITMSVGVILVVAGTILIFAALQEGKKYEQSKKTINKNVKKTITKPTKNNRVKR